MPLLNSPITHCCSFSSVRLLFLVGPKFILCFPHSPEISSVARMPRLTTAFCTPLREQLQFLFLSAPLSQRRCWTKPASLWTGASIFVPTFCSYLVAFWS